MPILKKFFTALIIFSMALSSLYIKDVFAVPQMEKGHLYCFDNAGALVEEAKVKNDGSGTRYCPSGSSDIREHRGSNVAIVSGCADLHNEEQIMCIIKLAINIFSVGIGVFVVIGIVVVGIQYITAGGNEEKTRKAKRRMFEIVLGALIYILLYAVLNWLTPLGQI